MKYGKVDLGQIEAMINKLGGVQGMKLLLADELIIVRKSDGAAVIPLDPRAWPVWKTLKIGTGIQDAKGFCSAIQDAGHEVTDWAEALMTVLMENTAAEQEAEVELVRVSGRDLSFVANATYVEICQRASQLGLDSCPAEVGPQLRLQYHEQPEHEVLMVAHQIVAGDSVDDPSVFFLTRGWLRADNVGNGRRWEPDSIWVFCRRTYS